MWSYSGGGWGQGYITPEPNNYVSQPSTYGGVDPAYSNGAGNSYNMGGLWSSVASGIGQYASAQAAADASTAQSKMSAQAQLDKLKQDREYQKQDREFKKDAASKWAKYFAD